MPLPPQATASSTPSTGRSHRCGSTSMTRSATSCRCWNSTSAPRNGTPWFRRGRPTPTRLELPLMFGMLMYEGDPEIIERALAAMPADARPVITALAPQTFAEHSRAVHGTPTPPRSTELMGSRHD